jgi:outer membrane immunogenic protein
MPTLSRPSEIVRYNRIVEVADRWGLIVRRFHFAAHSTAMFVAVTGAFLLSMSGAQAICFPSSGSNSGSASSYNAGGQAGYNWQRGSFVYGFETDLSATDLNASMNGGLTNISCATDTAATNAKIDWYGTVRGRAGWAAGKILFYGTGGLAYGNVDLNSSFNSAGLSLNSSTSSVRTGWVVGGGIEYMLQPNVALTLGYQYVDLGTANLASSTAAGSFTLGQTASARAAFQVVTGGIIWRFSPNPAQPWAGAYAGGHVGGAWGDTTNANYSGQTTGISDIRLKRDITLVGRLDDGLGLYQYRYLWSDTIYVGVMAQEVALVHPEAIVRNALDDYLRVDYGRLGLRLMTLPEWDARSKSERL